MKMNRCIGIGLITLLGMVLSACGSHVMKPAGAMTEVDNNYALVSFVRPSAFGGAIRFSIWDGEEFVGILTAGSMVQHRTTPGEHIFMAHAENWSYVQANLEAGRHYIVEGKVFPGVWKARVGLAPIDVTQPRYGEKAQKWVNGLKPITVKPELVDSYVTPRLPEVSKALNVYRQGDAKYGVLEADDGF